MLTFSILDSATTSSAVKRVSPLSFFEKDGDVIPKALAASFCKIPRHVSNVFMLSVAELSSALLDFDMP